MPVPAPPIDSRSFNDLVAQIERLLQRYSAWRPAAQGSDRGQALVRIGAHLAELVIDRLNRVPDKNFLSFLDLVGLGLLPPQPARVPLTFQLATGSTTDAQVPARTLVAAIPAEGETEPVFFETERELIVTRSQLVAVFTREPDRDLYSDYTDIASGQIDTAFSVFQANQPIAHTLYFGHTSLFGMNGAKEITLRMTPAEDTHTWLADVEWSYLNGTQRKLLPTLDTLTQANGGWEVTLPNVPTIPRTPVGEKTSAWLCGRLTKPLSPGTQALPSIDTIQARVHIEHAERLPELAYVNQLTVDLSKDFFPFGEKPKVGDTLYLASDEVFSRPQANITLTVTLTPSDGESTLPAKPSDKLTLVWEFWNAQQGKWDFLGASGPGTQQPSQYNFADGTEACVQNGQVRFSCPETIGPVEVNGQLGYWLRVRIATGNYGVEARYEPVMNPTTGRPRLDPNTGLPIYQLIPATFRPPSIQSLSLSSDYTSEFTDLDYTLSQNDFVLADHSEVARTDRQLFNPFTPATDTHPTFYLGFQRPGAESGFANQSAALYFRVAEVLYSESLAQRRAAAEPAAVVWEYWNGHSWVRLGTRDETHGFTRRGLVTFIGPPDFRASTEFGQTAFWLRARWARGEYAILPQVRRVLTNTMWATHTVTVQNEILGSSNGEPNQVFRTTKVPILSGQRIEIRESEMPSAAERTIIETEEGKDAISTIFDPSGRPAQIWVRWHQVPDFYESGPRSRHYSVDRLTGEIRFGDNQHGLIPPQLRANVRLAWYQTGGGLQRNRAAGSLTQLKSAVPYVDRVTNWEPADGGSAQESLEAVTSRGPQTLRHRNRAVLLADFEDLAFAVSPNVARVKAVAAQGSQEAGSVGLIIVPRSSDPQPIPSLALLDQVQDYLEARLLPTVELWTAGPDWLRVTVMADIVPISLETATDVQALILDRLRTFLHPLTGGLDGRGWAFGRKPYRSDLYALIEQMPRVDHVRRLTVAEEGEVRPDRFLVYSGDHRITMIGETRES